MKIMHIELGRFMYGGARQVQYLLKGLQGFSVQNTLVCADDSEVYQACQDVADICHPIPTMGDVDFNFIKKLRKIIRNDRPDFIHIHSRRGDMMSTLTAQLEKVPVILTRRVDNAEFPGAYFVKYPMLKQIIAISDGIKTALINSGVRASKILIARSAIDTLLFYPQTDHSVFRQQYQLSNEHITIGVVAQIIKRKGHAVLFNGIPEILKHNPNVRFLVFGQGSLIEELKELCKSLHIEHAVDFLGFRKDMENVVPHFDLLVHPALLEGLGMALLEASASGVPIVATKTGGIPEIVRDGVNGYLVEPNNTQDLVDKICKFLASEELRRKMGKKGLEVITEFSISSMVEKNYQIYQNLYSGADFIRKEVV